MKLKYNTLVNKEGRAIMSREWQQTKLIEYLLPNEVYYQCLWAVRDLDRMEKQIGEILNGKRQCSDYEKIKIEARVKAIKRALYGVPEGYRGYVMESIMQRSSNQNYPNKFWRIWKQRFLYNVAVNLAII